MKKAAEPLYGIFDANFNVMICSGLDSFELEGHHKCSEPGKDKPGSRTAGTKTKELLRKSDRRMGPSIERYHGYLQCILPASPSLPRTIMKLPLALLHQRILPNRPNSKPATHCCSDRFSFYMIS